MWSEIMSESDDVVDFEAAKRRIKAANQEKKEKDLESRFKKAMGWKINNKTKANTKTKTAPPSCQPKGPRGPRGKR